MYSDQFKRVKVQDIKTGDYLVNIGVVGMVEVFKPARQVAIHVYVGLVESALHFWYHYDQDLFIQKPLTT